MLCCQVAKTIRPDTVFADEKSANRLTNNALDPISKIPEFKVCAVQIAKA